MEIFDILVIAFNIFAVVYAIIRKKTGIYLNKNTYEIEGNGVFYTGLAGIIFLSINDSKAIQTMGLEIR